MNADERLKQREQISALADGQLRGVEFVATLEATAVDDDALACWHVYHLVGDVLRSEELGAPGRGRDFLARLNARLQAEPDVPRVGNGVQSPSGWLPTDDPQTLGTVPGIHRSVASANDASFRWKLVAGFASLAAVAAISWSAVGFFGAAPEGARLALSGTAPASQDGPARLAGAPSSVPAAPVMIRNRELDALMAAHRQSGGSSALQNPSGFLRNATFDGAAR